MFGGFEVHLACNYLKRDVPGSQYSVTEEDLKGWGEKQRQKKFIPSFPLIFFPLASLYASVQVFFKC